MKDIIYFDNAATTKPTEEIKAVLNEYLNNGWYNPSALYEPCAKVSLNMDKCRKTILSSIGGYDGEIVFTSGGTESNNIAVFNSYMPKKTNHYITSAYEHAAVYQAFNRLENMGQEVSYVKPDKHGVIAEKDVVDKIKENTVLVSIMHVNNETGAINDINKIASAVKAKNKDINFHSDGVQGFLKTSYTIDENIDFYSISGHKIGALKGTGALYVKKGIKPKSIMFGGGQEKRIRPGTENTLGIEVFEKAIKAFNKDYNKIFGLRNRLAERLCEMDDVVINSPMAQGKFSPYILNASVIGVKGETLLHALEAKGMFIGIGSACSSKSRTNRVHDALNLTADRGESAIRISFCDENELAQVDMLLKTIKSEAQTLRIFKRR
jgi:cysteine desulfurase